MLQGSVATRTTAPIEVVRVSTDAPAALDEGGEECDAPPLRRSRAMTGRLLTFLQAAPLAAVLVVFLLAPILLLIVVSFFDYASVKIIPAFHLTNYVTVLGSTLT